jgi:hypothetical protein
MTRKRLKTGIMGTEWLLVCFVLVAVPFLAYL